MSCADQNPRSADDGWPGGGGQSRVDESALTGDLVPLPKLEGDQVFSGTICLAGTFLVFATDAADAVITVEKVELVADTIEIGPRMVG